MPVWLKYIHCVSISDFPVYSTIFRHFGMLQGVVRGENILLFSVTTPGHNLVKLCTTKFQVFPKRSHTLPRQLIFDSCKTFRLSFIWIISSHLCLSFRMFLPLKMKVTHAQPYIKQIKIWSWKDSSSFCIQNCLCPKDSSPHGDSGS
jgi:hypothetical protein